MKRKAAIVLALALLVFVPPHTVRIAAEKRIPTQQNDLPEKASPLVKTAPTISPGLVIERDPAAVLRDTEGFLGPPRVKDQAQVAAELRQRGQEKAAQLVEISIKTTNADYERLSRRLLGMGELDAAEALLDEWAKKESKKPSIPLLRAAMRHAKGNLDLALRELDSVGPEITGPDRVIRGLHQRILLMAQAESRREGKSAGAEANPWGVVFADEKGNYVAGSIAANQAAKIPAGSIDALSRLVEVMPRQGNLWALLGELYNASGDVRSSAQCFSRARNLLYTPPLLRQHLAIVEEASRVRDAMALSPAANPDAAANQAVRGEKDQADVVEVAAGWSGLWSRPWILVILVVGGALTVAIAVLQLREWRNS